MVRTGSIEEISGHLAKRCSISCSRLHATLRVFWNDASEGASIAEFALAGFADSSVIRSVFQSPARSPDRPFESYRKEMSASRHRVCQDTPTWVGIHSSRN